MVQLWNLAELPVSCDFNLNLVVRVVQLVKEVTIRLGYRINDVIKVSFKSCVVSVALNLSLRHHMQHLAN
jgi:hypothetical protein